MYAVRAKAWNLVRLLRHVGSPIDVENVSTGWKLRFRCGYLKQTFEDTVLARDGLQR